MNTEAQIKQVMQDYQRGRMGHLEASPVFAQH